MDRTMTIESRVFPDMDKAFATTLSPSPIVRKTAARAALVGFNDSTHSLSGGVLPAIRN